MENEILIALITKHIEDRIAELPVISGPRGPRGFHGTDGEAGRPGKDFIFSEHEETIRNFAKDYAIKFADFTSEQIEQLRGPRGRDGRDFNFSEHEDTIKNWSKEFALKFSDLTHEQIEALRGPSGKDGADGKNFDYDEHRSRIAEVITETVNGLTEQLRLKFTDLTEENINELRGPRGRDGRDGRDFNFDEHREFFDSLRLKFSDLTDDEKESLKLHFSELTEEEKSSLKLRFKDLTQDDLALIRGPRGPRGQRGSVGAVGATGLTGLMGPRGLPGPRGISGLTGERGKDGAKGESGNDGADAPRIVSIDIQQIGNDIIFIFQFSDGSTIESDRVTLPAAIISGGGGVAGGRRMDFESRIDEVSDVLMYVGKAIPGNETNTAVWQIQKITVVGTETIIEFADGDAKFDNVWDDRGSLTYA